MATEIATAYFSIAPSARGVQRKLQSELGPQMDRLGDDAGKRMGSRMGSKVKGLVAGALAGISVGAAFNFANDAVAQFSELEDASGAAGVIFGKNMGDIEKASKNAATELGLSQAQYIDASNTFGVFGKSAGKTGKDLSGFANEMTKTAADMASFRGGTPEEAIEAVGAALRGESEPIRKYGVLLDDATLKARAMAMGIYEGTGALTPQQKVLAAQQEILHQTADAQGDFARTSDSTANTQKRQAAQAANLRAEIGEKLAPAFTKMREFGIKAMNGISKFIPKVVRGFKNVSTWVKDNQEKLKLLGLVVGGATAAWLIYRGVLGAVTVATNIANLATKIFNGTLRANPIGLVVTAIGALVGAIVYLYNHNKTAKKIIDAVWRGIKTAIKAVADWWTKTAWPAIRKVVVALGSFFRAAGKTIGAAWRNIKSAAGTAWAWIKKYVFLPFKIYIAAWKLAFTLAKKGVILAWGAVKTALGNGWSWIKKNVFGPIKTGIGAVKSAFSTAKKGIGTVWSGLKTTLRSGWTWIKKNVFDRLGDGLRTVKRAFGSARDGIKIIWNKLKAIAAKPINFILGTVYNDGIAHWWNTIANALKLKSLKLPAAKLVKFAEGSEDHRAQIAPAGAYRMWAEQETGGEAYIPLSPSKRTRSTQILGNVANRFGYNLTAFKDGGFWDKVGGAWSKTWRTGAKISAGAVDALKKIGGAAVNFIKDPAGTITNGLGGLVKGWLKGLMGGDLGKMVGALPGRLVGGLKTAVMRIFNNDNTTIGSGAGAPGTSGKGLRGNLAAMARAANSLMGGGVRVTSGYRPGARTVTGYPSFHGLGRAIDMVHPNMGLLWERLYRKYGKVAPEIFFSGKNFSRYGKLGNMRQDHWDHVHWAMANGGIIPKVPVFDNGGTLGRGLNIVNNATGAPEKLVRAEAAVGQKHYHFHGITDAAGVIEALDRRDRKAAAKANILGRQRTGGI